MISKTMTDRLKQNRILIAEDEEPIRLLYCHILEREGYLVDAACDGEEAWEFLLRPDRSYDLLITDNQMPRLRGAELIRRMHSQRLALPVIMASSTPISELESSWISAHLPKPLGINELLDTVRQLLGKGVQA